MINIGIPWYWGLIGAGAIFATFYFKGHLGVALGKTRDWIASWFRKTPPS